MLSSQKMMSAPSGGGSDDNFKNVTLLLNGNGTNGAQNNTFVDSSSNNFSITRNGNTTQGSFSPYGSLWSNYFNGSTDYLSTSSISLGSTFTIGAWVCLTGNLTDRNPIINVGDSDSGGSGCLLLYRSNEIQFRLNGTTTGTGASVSSGVWNYISVTRSSGTITIYLNGTSVATISNSSTFSGTVKIGGATVSATDYFTTGYLSNVYINTTTASSSVPTSPSTAVSGTQLLTCQSNRFIDNSSNAFALTVNGTPSVQRFSPFNPTASYDTATIGGSGYFDGSGDYLSMNPSSLPSLGVSGSNFTIETWVYIPTNTTVIQIISRGGGAASWSSTNGNSWGLFVYNGNWYFQFNIGGTYAEINASTNFSLNCWHHVAVSYDGTTTALFVDGVRIGTTTGSYSPPSSQPYWYICRGADGGSVGNGYITDTRIVTGSYIYNPSSSTLTVPTAPLTAVSGTQFLVNYTNAGIPDSAMMNDLETVGNAQVSTTQKKFGTGSLYFDGTGDCLYVPNSPNLIFSGDFTIECWANFTSFPDNVCIFGVGDFGASDYSFAFRCYSNAIQILWGSGGGTASTTLNTSTWYHLALVRNNGTVNVYVNGTSILSFSNSNSNLSTQAFMRIGSATNDGAAYQNMNGYIDDLRITKGYARYTANFTPPTAALPVK